MVKKVPSEAKSSKGAVVAVAAMVIFSLLSLFPVASKGYSAYQDIVSKPETEKIYQDLKPKRAPGFEWARSFVSSGLKDVGEWKVASNERPVNPVSHKVCSMGEVPKTSMLTTKGSGSNFELYAQVYGAGQGRVAYENFKKKIDSCGNFEEVKSWNDSGIYFVKFNNSIIASAGDAIVGFTSPNEDGLKAHEGEILERMRLTLSESKCLDVDSSAEDSTRSFFYDRGSYTGLSDKTFVETKVKTDGFSKPLYSEKSELNYPYLTVPESPLPEGFPDRLPESVEEPNAPAEPQKGNYTGEANYLVPDDSGPGCGWVWTGQKTPVYDREGMEKEKQKSIGTLQDSLDQQASEYSNSRIIWTVDSMEYMSNVNRWNTFVIEHNKVTDRWKWLNDEREKFQPVWEDWVEEYKLWKSFPERQERAKTQWEKDLKVCRDNRKAHDEWESTYGSPTLQDPPIDPTQPAPTTTPEDPAVTGFLSGGAGAGSTGILVLSPAPPAPDPSPTPQDPGDQDTPTPTEPPSQPAQPGESESPTLSPSQENPGNESSPSPTPVIPPEPMDCPVDPAEPRILSQQRGEAPEAPKPPDGVTIPESWEDPR